MSEESGSSVRPVALRKQDEEHLVIDWSDGKRCVYSWRLLRERCPCATCREAQLQPPDPFRIVNPAELQPLRAVAIQAIGYYAYKITWSDGHDTGLYTIEYLRELCDCQTEQKG